MDIFGPKPWVNPFGKCQCSTLWTSCFYSLETRFFVLEYHKTYFPGLYCVKKTVGQTAILSPKPWVNPFEKKANFSTFWTSWFYSLDERFFVLEYQKIYFPGLYCLKKNFEIWAFFDQNHVGSPIWKNVNFSTFQTSCFYSIERRFSF